jgi:hypothetical protein
MSPCRDGDIRGDSNSRKPLLGLGLGLWRVGLLGYGGSTAEAHARQRAWARGGGAQARWCAGRLQWHAGSEHWRGDGAGSELMGAEARRVQLRWSARARAWTARRGCERGCGGTARQMWMRWHGGLARRHSGFRRGWLGYGRRID